MAWLSLLVAIALIWWLMKLGRGALFEIRLQPGKVLLKRGSVPPRFLAQAKQILQQEPVRGRILGQRDGNGVRLVFSAPSLSPWPSACAAFSPMGIIAALPHPGWAQCPLNPWAELFR